MNATQRRLNVALFMARNAVDQALLTVDIMKHEGKPDHFLLIHIESLAELAQKLEDLRNKHALLKSE